MKSLKDQEDRHGIKIQNDRGPEPLEVLVITHTIQTKTLTVNESKFTFIGKKFRYFHTLTLNAF